MNDPKAAAAYHPGDAPVTRPDLDALREQFAEAAYRAEKTHDFGESWTEEFADESDSYKATYYAIADALLGILLAALAAERARADQAERDVTNAENYGIRWMKRAQEAEHRIADALSCLRASSVPLGMTEVMFQDRLITEARRVLSVAPTAEQ